MRRFLVCVTGLLVFSSCVGAFRAAAAAELPESILGALVPRPVGPANMSGRITSIAVADGKPTTCYIGAASSGVWKTTNAGITWTPVFDEQGTSSIGAVAVAPSNPDIVWVGTGEANARNSVSCGDGVYRSEDGGKTWRHCGLRETHHIGRIVVHPRDPDTAWVAAVGHLWGPNKQRGIFKTTDGGKRWENVHFLDADTGCVDLVIDPDDPDTLYTAAYRVRRGPFSGGDPAVQFGPAAGLYRTRDGGKAWARLTRGLPDRPLGRCGIDVYRKDPRILYAVVQTDRTNTLTVMGQPPTESNKVENGGVFRSEDRGDTWVKVNNLCPRPFYFGQVRIDPNNDRRVYVLGIFLHVSRNGGRSFSGDSAPAVHADHHALWIDPADSDHLLLGSDGGLSLSHDRGRNWEHFRNLPLAQFYACAVDMRRPYRVYGGLQDNGTWGGPSRTTSPEGITHADWFRLMGADGFYCQVDPTDPDTVYAEAQWGGIERINVRTGQDTDIKPTPPTLLSASYRFNWSSPILLSPHNPRTVYFGGNHVFRSVDRGAHWETISPDLTRGKPGASADNGHTITTIAESPLKPGLLWAGTDDGRVHFSRNGGVEWTDVGTKIPDVPAERHISRIECSPFAAGTAWVTIDRHRQDDAAPYIFRTDNFGSSWKPLIDNLPTEGHVHVLRASSRHRDLLFAGTETGLFVSIDAGEHWQPLRKGLPTVPVHDLVLHPRDRELVIATHGRGMYILDVAPLEEFTPAVRAQTAHLFEIKPATVYEERFTRDLSGGKMYAAPNPPFGAGIWYWLKEPSSQPVRVTISDPLGRGIAEIAGDKSAGLHRAQWNLRGGAGVDFRGAKLAPPGDYVVRLHVGDKMIAARKLRIEPEE
jgi:photosystem II stability/assembly factor-like uncharacterized protein